MGSNPNRDRSAAHSTLVLVAIDGKKNSTSIGTLVDAYLPPILSSDQHDVMPVFDLKCPGVSSTEKVAWANVTHVSRHPANGDMLTVKTVRGRTLKMTASHSFLVRDKNRVVQRTGSDLVLGDCLPIVKDMPGNQGVLPNAPVPLTRATGRFIGAVVSEGTVNRERTDVTFTNTEREWTHEIGNDFSTATDYFVGIRNFKMSHTALGSGNITSASVCHSEFASWMAEHFGCTPFNKKLPAWILDAPDEFVTGLLQTYFDGDGNVQTEARHHRLCCHSVSSELGTMLCLCLARYGIVTYVGTKAYKTPTGESGTIHRITIPMCFAAKFQEHIGFSVERKVEKLAQVVKKQEAVGMRGFQAHVPGMNEVLEEVRKDIPPGGDKNSFETLLRKEFRRIQRKTGVTPKMLMRCREHAVTFNAPTELVAELDQAINADVWWDPIMSIEIEKGSTEMVYDFTVDEKLQSFMLSNGIFVHNTLNTFHYSGCGARGVTQGIPRLKELLDVTRKVKTPSNCLALTAPFCHSRNFATQLASTLPRATLSFFVASTDILYEPQMSEPTMEQDRLMVQIDNAINPLSHSVSSWIGRLTLRKSVMKVHHLTPPHLMSMLSYHLRGKAHILASETNALEWVLRVRFFSTAEMIERIADTDHSSDRVSEETLVYRIMSTLCDSIHISGHEHVMSAREREIEVWDMKADQKKNVYVIDTLGTAFIELGLLPCVDWNRSWTNDLFEAKAVLGLEAATHILVHEITSVISYDGTYVDRRHMMQVMGAMTWQGWIKAISRHGMNRPDSKTGPLVRCSFEETSDVLMDAALWSEVDDSRGVTSSVINGDPARIGTYSFDVLMPDSMLPLDLQRKGWSSKLGKSRVRKSGSSVDSNACMELIDTNLMTFSDQTAGHTIDMPFSTSDDADCVPNSSFGGGIYAMPPKPRTTERVFTPSSPKVIIG